MKIIGLLLFTLFTTVAHAQVNWIELGYSGESHVSFAFKETQDPRHIQIESKWQSMGSDSYTIQSYEVDCLNQASQLNKQQRHSPTLTMTTTHVGHMQMPKINTMHYMMNSTACLFARVQHEQQLILAKAD